MHAEKVIRYNISYEINIVVVLHIRNITNMTYFPPKRDLLQPPEVLSISSIPYHELLTALNNIKSGIFTSAAMSLSIVSTFTKSIFYPYKNNMMVLPSLC